MNARELLDRYGPWVLVTGASSGIGREFAQKLGAGGFNVAMVARRRAALESLARDLTSAHAVECRVIEMDLAEAGAAERLAEAVADLEIGLLIANAGTGWIGRFDKQAPESHASLIRLHCEMHVELTARLLPPMIARRRGGVVIVSSMGGMIPLPYYAVYSGTKALLQNWGEALALEMKGTGIAIQVLAPGDTKTGFQEVAGEMSTKWSTVAEVVEESLSGLGVRTVVVPGFDNKLSLWLARFLPRKLFLGIVEKRQREQTPEGRK
jgi:short-subunit dehydrogenase